MRSAEKSRADERKDPKSYDRCRNGAGQQQQDFGFLRGAVQGSILQPRFVS